MITKRSQLFGVQTWPVRVLTHCLNPFCPNQTLIAMFEQEDFVDGCDPERGVYCAACLDLIPLTKEGVAAAVRNVEPKW